MKQIWIFSFWLLSMGSIWGQQQTIHFDVRGKEDCEDNCDNDGDGYIDCADLDCLINTALKRDGIAHSRSKTSCPELSIELLDHIQELFDANVVGVCSNLNSNNLLNKILNNCGQDCTLSDFDEELAKEDRIIIDASFSGNEKMNCVWNKFISNDNNVLCDMTSYFFGNSTIDLKYTVEDFMFDEANARTSVKELDSKGFIKIKFSEEKVEKACEVSLMKTLIHENIHAEMFRVINDPNVDINDFPAIYEADRQRRGWQHDVMSDFYRDKIEESLKSIYGSAYTDNEYEALAWQGLNETIHEGYTNSDGTVVPDDIVFNTETWANLTETERQRIRDINKSIEENCEKNCTDN